MRKLCFTALLFCLMLLSVFGCSGSQIKTVQKTQLEIRQMQTRTYDTQNTKMVVKAMLNVLQDDGFIVNQADLELGFLNATKEVDVENPWEKFWATYEEGWKKNSITTCTANVSQFGDKTRVRVNFQVKVMTNLGGVATVYQIDDPEYYQKFFSKVDKGIFIEKEKI